MERSLEIQLAVLVSEVKEIKGTVTNIEDKLNRNYVTIDKFEPVRNIAYGFVALILTSVLIAVLALVLRGAQ